MTATHYRLAMSPRTNCQPIGDGELIRTAVREGWLEPEAAERALACGDASLALSELVNSGKIDRERLSELRQQMAFAREPELLGPYKIQEVLGHGGMGVVYRAVDGGGKEVAVKVLSPHLAADRVFQRRFQRESEVVSSIQSPYVVSCHGYGDEHGRLYLAMELMRGGDAQELLDASGGFLPEAKILSMCRDTAAGLEVIHAAGLIHRDVKPENIFLGDGQCAKIGDFSIVHLGAAEDDKITAAGKSVGTPGFIAPEQARADHRIDGRADIYALGASMYYLLTGHAPFIGTSANDVLSQAMIRPIPDPRLIRRDCTEAVSAIVRCAGALAPKDRYPSIALMRADIELAMAGKLPKNRPVSASVTTEFVRRKVRHREIVKGGLRVLIVRSNPLNECSFEKPLMQAGYHVLMASASVGGGEVLELKPDVIVLDVENLDQNQLNFVRNVRAQATFAATPILVLSNIKDQSELDLLRDAGANMFVTATGDNRERLPRVIDDLLSNVLPTVEMKPTVAPVRESAENMRERIAPALWQATQLLDRMQEGEISERGVLLEIAEVMRPVVGFGDPSLKSLTACLTFAIEGLARQLHGWLHHVNASSLTTLRQALQCLERALAEPPEGTIDNLVALVIDDDLVSRKTMCQALKKIGLRSDPVADTEHAFQALAAKKYSIVLSDVMMDGMNGIQFAEKMRGIEACRTVPIILVTGLTDFDKIFHARSDGANDVIAKPFLLMELATKALTHLCSAGGGVAAGGGAP